MKLEEIFDKLLEKDLFENENEWLGLRECFIEGAKDIFLETGYRGERQTFLLSWLLQAESVANLPDTCREAMMKEIIRIAYARKLMMEGKDADDVGES